MQGYKAASNKLEAMRLLFPSNLSLKNSSARSMCG